MSKSYQKFESFLKENRLVKEKRLKYYVYWVELLTKHCDNRLQNISRNAITTYLEKISRWKKWEIRLRENRHQWIKSRYPLRLLL